jgi:hypothetical protein
LVDQEFGSDETVVGCSYGHPSEVILILIQEISLITSTITESKWPYCIFYFGIPLQFLSNAFFSPRMMIFLHSTFACGTM